MRKLILLILSFGLTGVIHAQAPAVSGNCQKVFHDIIGLTDTSNFKIAVQINSSFQNLANQWAKDFETRYHYSSDGELLSQNLIQYPDHFQQINLDSLNFFYYSNGNQKQIDEYIPNNQYNYYLRGQQFFHLNAEGLIDTFTYKEFLFSTGKPENNHRHVYSYNALDNEAAIYHFEWDTTLLKWNPTEKYLSAYNASDLILSYTGFQWNSLSSSWENLSVDSTFYDAFNLPEIKKSLHWVDSISTWMPLLEEHTFRSAANRIDSVKMYNAFSADTLQLVSVYKNKFDQFDNLTEQNIIEYTNGIQSNHYQYFLNYNSNYTLNTKLYSTLSGGNWINNSLDSFSYDSNKNITSVITSLWDNATASWKYDHKVDYIWNDFRIGQNVPDNLFTVIPNPAFENEIHLHLPPLASGVVEIEIFNTAAQLVLKKEMTVEQILHVDLPTNLANGNYTVRLLSGGIQFSSVFLLVR